MSICHICKSNDYTLEKNHIYPNSIFKGNNNKIILFCEHCHQKYTYIAEALRKWFILDKNFFDWLSSMNEVQYNDFYSATKKFNHELKVRIFNNIYPNVYATEFSFVGKFWQIKFSSFLKLIADLKGLRDDL